MAEKSVGRRATRRRSIAPGRIQARERIVNDFGADGVLARDRLSAATLKNLGPRKRGKGCLYLKSLEGIDLTVLEGLVRTAIEKTRARGIAGCAAPTPPHRLDPGVDPVPLTPNERRLRC
jgi:hypothetical protein